MKHLTPDELIDALDGSLTQPVRQHLDRCEHCQAQLGQLSHTLSKAQDLEVPEPSPLFWDHLSARIREALPVEAASGGARWLRWPILAPLGALALVVAALVVTMPRVSPPLPVEVAEAPSVDITLGNDGWSLVADVLADLDWDTASAAGLMVEPGAADRVAQELSVDEQRELSALLQAELQRIKS